MTITRRTIIRFMGAAGGVAGAGAAMDMLGMRGGASALARPETPRGSGRVLVLGGGIAGLTAAYELEQAGFECVIVEARDRLGGRNWTLRDGTKVPHRDGEQTARFADGDYFNAGPARMPGFHANVLDYCRRFEVALEPFVYENQNAFVVSDRLMGGTPLRHRQYEFSLRAFEDELVMKSLDAGVADLPVAGEEGEALKALMDFWTMKAGPFAKTARTGFRKRPSADLLGPENEPPLSIQELMTAPDIGIAFSTFDYIDWQTSLMQPVGGMDRIVEGFERNIRSPKILGAEVVSVKQSDDGVAVAWRDRRTNAIETLEGDYAVLALPLPLVDKMDVQCSSERMKAVRKGLETFESSIKIAWPAKRRFWEIDEAVYGGASIVDGEPMAFWYPSNGFGAKTGVLLGAYSNGDFVKRLDRRPLSEQIEISRGFGRRMHKAFDADAGEATVVSWGNQPYSEAAWGFLADDLSPEGPYAQLRSLEGRLVFAGDYLSQFHGWQEGAVLSAHVAVKQIAEAAVQGR